MSAVRGPVFHVKRTDLGPELAHGFGDVGFELVALGACGRLGVFSRPKRVASRWAISIGERALMSSSRCSGRRT